jgi:ATP-dependent helicase/nuclease subunit B
MRQDDEFPSAGREAVLRIRWVPGLVRPTWGREVLDETLGGPESLLSWLETQLGLPVPPGSRAVRVAAYAAALETAERVEFSLSLKADRWATAAALLDRRDELLLSGWNGVASECSPSVVRALAAVERSWKSIFLSEAERLCRVDDALSAGQELPPHQCRLADPVRVWPAVWQRVLSRLTTVNESAPRPSAPRFSTLQRMQEALLAGERAELASDGSFRQVRTRSASAAVEFVAAVLARDRSGLARTVIVCEEDDLALRLEGALRRLGVPTMGATGWSVAHPVLQVLPLTLAMSWAPIDPEVVLAFLTLPTLPIPRFAARLLAKALTEEPGVGSSEWERAMTDLVTEYLESVEKDEAGGKPVPDEALRDRLKAWFEGERAPRGGMFPTALVRQRCGMVAQWAAGRAAAMEQTGGTNPGLIEALKVVAGQASLLGELAECQGPALSEPQLDRLLEDVLSPGMECQSHPEAEGGPIRVRSLAEIGGPVDRLIWLGPVTEASGGGLWSVSQTRELRAAGINVDDGSRALSARRDAEVQGFCNVGEAALVVMTPLAEEQRWHPVWLAARARLAAAQREESPVLEDLIADGSTRTLEPFVIACTDFAAEPPPGRRALWAIPPDLMSEREQVSATELEDRLACPLKWVFRHQAKLYPAFTAELPDEHRLKGTFAHRVLERALGGGGPLPTVAEAVARVLAVFDERFTLDAAPLALPNRQLAVQRFRRELERSTRVLAEMLTRGGYRILGFEVAVEGSALDRPLTGRVDCLAQQEGGAEAVLDFKYGGRTKYQEALKEGRAVQLATYAHGRSQVIGSQPAVAYLILSDGLLYTPRASAVAGAGSDAVVSGPGIQEVWLRFATALNRAGDWLNSGAPVPARPLQEAGLWPEGTTLVLKDKLKEGERQAVCRYCDYQRLCGLEETR